MLKRLGVRDIPSHTDALDVLREVSQEFGSKSLPLDESARAVVSACWQLLENVAIESEPTAESIRALRNVKSVPNAKGILFPPEWMFFENRAGLAGKFGEFLASNVIPRPLGAARAYSLAGVRQLGSAVQVELLECVDPTPDNGVGEVIHDRRNQIGRVLDSQNAGWGAAGALARLSQVQCKSAADLTLRYSLHAFGQELHSDPEQVPALYFAGESTLLFCRRDGQVPWTSIARELAIALFPDEDPGRFAAGLKEVLASRSTEEASAALDELGFAKLDTAISNVLLVDDGAATLGIETPIAGSRTSPEEATDEALRENALPTTWVDVSSGGPEGAPGGRGAAEGSRSGKKVGRPVLRSYLPAPETPDAVAADGDEQGDQAQRKPVDVAGVMRVMGYEKSCNRIPLEMAHKHEGYDVESRNLTGSIVRVIEVKSLTGRWADSFAVLSKAQFKKSWEKGDLFWLYVVERAMTDDFAIYRIQNPAEKANHFMFDDGWRAIAEITSTSET